jgi:fatty-acyl-CoA synthase
MSSVDDSLERRVTTVGTGMPHIEIKVINPETGDVVPPNTPGELCCRGYNLMKGYYNLPDETARAIDQDGWLHSGDIGTVDENGYYCITGRIKDMIIRGGENIYPKEIEEFLRGLSSVRDVQVVGIPSQKYGEEVGAFIILKEGASLTEEEVTDFCIGKISRYKIPKHIFFVDEFPMTASGKIQKFKLRESVAQNRT